LITCPPLIDAAEGGDEIEIDVLQNTIRLRHQGFTFPPLSDQVLEMLQAGGLVPYLRKRLGLVSSDPVAMSGE
jgi:3-isopropylmalate dehydratase small subunit